MPSIYFTVYQAHQRAANLLVLSSLKIILPHLITLVFIFILILVHQIFSILFTAILTVVPHFVCKRLYRKSCFHYYVVFYLYYPHPGP